MTKPTDNAFEHFRFEFEKISRGRRFPDFMKDILRLKNGNDDFFDDYFRMDQLSRHIVHWEEKAKGLDSYDEFRTSAKNRLDNIRGGKIKGILPHELQNIIYMVHGFTNLGRKITGGLDLHDRVYLYYKYKEWLNYPLNYGVILEILLANWSNFYVQGG
jgi:hypothetical protein